MTVLKDGAVAEEDVPLRNAMNEVLRDAYVEDCQRGVDRWNKRLAEAGLSERLRLPSKRFYRHIGLYADLPFDPDGRLARAGGVGAPQGRVAAHPGRPRLRGDAAGGGARAGQDRELAGPARARHQGPALRIRVRPARLKPGSSGGEPSRIRPLALVQPEAVVADARPAPTFPRRGSLAAPERARTSTDATRWRSPGPSAPRRSRARARTARSDRGGRGRAAPAASASRRRAPDRGRAGRRRGR